MDNASAAPDTDRPLRLDVKGTTYQAAPMEEEHVVIIMSLRVGRTPSIRVIRMVTEMLAKALGPVQWNELSDRWLEAEVTFKELGDALGELIKLTAAHAEQNPRA